MAGNLKPDGVGKEIKIAIDVMNCSYTNSKDTLSNGILDTNVYQNAVLMEMGDYLVFSINKRCNIWAITGFHRDGANTQSNQPVRLHKLEGNSEILIGDYPTVDSRLGRQYNEWYKLFPDLPHGTYKLTAIYPYVGFQEFYGEATGEIQLYLNKTKEAYGMSNSTFTKLADNWSALTPTEQKALFISTNYETATADDLQTLGKFKILSYSETEDKPEPILTAVPKDQLITPKGLINITAIEGIDKATLTATISGSSSCKLLVTTDLTAYQTYDAIAQEWQVIDHTDLVVVKALGIDAKQLQDIDRTGWDKLIAGKEGIGFAYLLIMDNVADVSKIDQLNLQVDLQGAWKKAVHGSDYDYEYPSNNLLQVSIKASGDYKINYPE